MPPKSKKTPVTEPAVSTPVVSTPVVTEPVVTVEPVVDNLSTAQTEFMTKLTAMRQQITSMLLEFRNLQKRTDREMKTAQKASGKRKNKNANRKPSGFVKPTLISDELANFLQKPVGSEMARTEVTREINGYIRAHDLQDKANGRKINPDTHLAALLKIGSGEELTYFNLQRYMSPHFAKSAPKVAA